MSPGTGPQPRSASPGHKPLLLKQPIMLRVVYALVPVLASGIYFFGWRVLALVAFCTGVGFATEYLTSRQRGSPVSMACFVTCGLYTLSLPPTMPFWMAAVGIVVAILFGKEAFGGFGRNFANPAIVGRAFVYVCFPTAMTASFVPALRGWPGGLGQWSFTALARVPDYVAGVARTGVDAMTAASPMLALRDYGYTTGLWDLVLGTAGGTFETPTSYGPRVLAAGSIGEGCAPLIVLAGLYLMLTQTSNWRLTVSTVAGALLAGFLIWVGGARDALPLYFKLLTGAFLYVAVFMVTDPVSAPKRPGAMIAYGGLIGLLIILISWKSHFIAAASFAVLLGNIVSPLLDMAATAWRDRAKKASQGAAG